MMKMTNTYQERNKERVLTYERATMKLVEHFIIKDTSDDSKDDKLLKSQIKVDLISYELRHPDKMNLAFAIDGYKEGSKLCKTDFINGINNVSEITYPWFNEAAKTVLTTNLTPTN